ncbi:MAG TPA: UDP-N-acetylmuramoyl-tripeptide--D-alanyl-D-alanine ligase [Candidatus Limnocylindria bacterium]|nr:UDP-N-acetylmuramoyl-tripeptide--D-alanyl-D-alanine ligase [Candidatus Limnocylindria bacterium]
MSAPASRLAAGVEIELADLLAATGGELHHLGAAVRVCGVTTDTRGLEAGELFVPIRGPQHDGHAHLAAAAAAGAAAVLLEREACPGPAGTTTIVVRDTLAALGDLARWHRRRTPARVLAVAGSNGKTTTKEMLAAIVVRAAGAGGLVATEGSQNNLVGLPLTLLRVSPAHAFAVVELGMNVPGELWQLAGIAEPDLGVVTCIGPEHLEGVGSLRGAACAEGELFRRLRPQAVAVVNGDDPLVVEQAAGFPGRRLVFGTHGEVGAESVEDLGIEGTRFVLRLGAERRPVRLALAGRHNVSNACAAAAMAYAAGIPSDTIVAGLEHTAAPSMRMEIRRLPGDVTVVFDCYNANPASMAAALQTMAASRAGRRLAVLGEMRELGEHAEAACRELGRAAAAGLDALVVLGAQAEIVAESAVEAGMDASRVTVATDHGDAARRVRALLRAGDVLLLKGSRGAALERVFERLEREA